MYAVAAASEALVSAGFACKLGSDLGAARDEDYLIADALFTADLVDLGDVLVMDIVVADDRGSHYSVGVHLDSRVDELLAGAGGAEIHDLHAVLLDAAVLDVDYLAETYGVLVLANGGGDYLHGPALDIGADDVVGEHVGLLGDNELIHVYLKRDLALDLYAGTVLRVHYLAGNDFTFRQIHPLCALERGSFRYAFRGGEEHGEHNGAVGQPLHLGTDLIAAGSELLGLSHTDVDVIGIIKLVDVDYLLRALERAAAQYYDSSDELI